MKPAVLVLTFVGCSLLGASCSTGSSVNIYEETLTLPTYETGRPDPNPRFYAGRAYQGAQGRVYPYPILDQLTDSRVDKEYTVVYLENEYVKIGVLPEIGGRVFEALDKTNNYDILYRQHVIKPALIGMLGAWISGGIEWNFPHHHRARAFMPMDYETVENPDGSATVWLSEIELHHRMRFTVGVTVFPGKSYFEVTVRPYNATPLVQSFLYWANPAVHVDSTYQVIFPPGTQFAAYHGKNDFAIWPIAGGEYRSIDYSGVDISWWKNHPSPISFFAWNYEDDFLAGYDHGQDAGVVYVANHHIAPGKKFWEWGPGPRGSLWDEILTEDDGPYIELMAGAYSDNQPDYSWLQPYESKEVRQYWYPARQVGGVKSATLDAAVNLEISNENVASIGLNTTAKHRGARLLLVANGQTLLEREINIDPDTPFSHQVALSADVDPLDVRVSLITRENQVLVSYKPVSTGTGPIPEPVTRPPAPGEIGTVDELYLAGQRLEQFHSAALDPMDYYEEALRRDAGDSRVNVAVGQRSLRRGLFEDATASFRRALTRTTKDYTSPRDGEASYYLGLSLEYQGNHEAAYDAFYKATWSGAFHSAAYYHLARIDCRRGEFEMALEHLDRSIASNATSRKTLDLRAAVLRHLGNTGEAAKAVQTVLDLDPLDLWAHYENHLATSGAASISRAREALAARLLARFELEVRSKPWHEARDWLEAQPFIETAAEYGHAGLWDEAIGLLSVLTGFNREPPVNTYPMLYYFQGYFLDQMGDSAAALDSYRRAAEMPPEYGFPFRLESIEVLRSASRRNPADGLAPYYLGNLLYDRRPLDAIQEWERARFIDEGLSTLHRNLAFAYFQVQNDIGRAVASIEEAIARDATDPRLFYELDMLYAAAGVSPERRLELLRENHDVLVSHGDALSREVVLLTQLGFYDEAIEYMQAHHFRRWEGVGNIHTTYVDAHLLRGREHIRAGRYETAVRDFETALQYPKNLEVARPYTGGRSVQIHYMIGLAHEAAGNQKAARESFLQAADGPRPAGPSALDFYQGMAASRLGRATEANRLLDGLISHGSDRLRALQSGSSVEFFAKFGTVRSLNEQRASAHYLQGLGYLGRRRIADARAAFSRALSLNPNHLWATALLVELR